MTARTLRLRGIPGWLALAVGAAALLVGCGGGTDDGDGRTTIGFMPKLVGIEYFNACEVGAKEAAAELGVNLVYDGPIVNDAAKQVEMIDTWIMRGFDVICVAPNDPNSVAPVLRKARERGMVVLSYDADAKKDARQYFVNQATYEDIAVALVDVMAEGIGNEGEVAIITGSLTAENQNIWIDNMRKHMKKAYPKMVEVDFRPSEEDQQVAFQVAQDIMKAHPNLKGIFGMTSVALPGAAGAVEQAEAADQVFVTGVSTPSSMRQYVKSGAVKKFVLWNPVDLGYLTVHVGVALANQGLPADANIFQAGRLGTVEIRGDEVLLGKPLIFDAANIDDFDF